MIVYAIVDIMHDVCLFLSIIEGGIWKLDQQIKTFLYFLFVWNKKDMM